LIFEVWTKLAVDQADQALNHDLIAKIRHCTNKSLILNTEKFRAQAAKLVT